MSGSDADAQASVGSTANQGLQEESPSTSASSLKPGDPLRYEFAATVSAQVRQEVSSDRYYVCAAASTLRRRVVRHKPKKVSLNMKLCAGNMSR
jgi:hypothetical protein